MSSPDTRPSINDFTKKLGYSFDVRAAAISDYTHNETLQNRRGNDFSHFFDDRIIHRTENGRDLRSSTILSSPSALISLGPKDDTTGFIHAELFDFSNNQTGRLVKKTIFLPIDYPPPSYSFGNRGKSVQIAAGNRIFSADLDSPDYPGILSHGNLIQANLLQIVPCETITSLHENNDGELVWGGISKKGQTGRKHTVVGIEDEIIASGTIANDSTNVFVTTDMAGNIVAHGLRGSGVTLLDRKNRTIDVRTSGIEKVLSCGNEGEDRVVMLQSQNNKGIQFVKPDSTTTPQIHIPFTAKTAIRLGKDLTLLGGRNDHVGLVRDDGTLLGARTLSPMAFTRGGIAGLTLSENRVFALSNFESIVYELPRKLTATDVFVRNGS